MKPTNPRGAAPGGRGMPWIRLAGSLLLELATNGMRMVLFLFRRGAYRTRIRGLLLGRPAGEGQGEELPRAAKAAVLACCALLTLAGCCGSSVYRGGGRTPGTQFSREIDETVDSVVTILEMPGWQESLVSDLENIVNDDPCLIGETFELWGW
jgi:hypothetical protein